MTPTVYDLLTGGGVDGERELWNILVKTDILC